MTWSVIVSFLKVLLSPGPTSGRPAGGVVGSRETAGRWEGARWQNTAGSSAILQTRGVFKLRASTGRFTAALGEHTSSNCTMAGFHFQEQSLGYSDAAARAKVYRGTPPVTALITLWGRGIILPQSRERHHDLVRDPSRWERGLGPQVRRESQVERFRAPVLSARRW